MKKLLVLFTGVILSVLALSALVSCGGPKAELYMITDNAVLKDGSFNEGAYNGMTQFKEKQHINFAYQKPITDSKDDYITTIKQAINNGGKVIVCVGYTLAQAVGDLQGQYPNVKFILIDATPQDASYKDKLASNTQPVLFRDNQAGFLAGYAAIKNGYKKLGYIGGMAVPSVIRFGAGYIAGAAYAYSKTTDKSALTDPLPAGNYIYEGDFRPSPKAVNDAKAMYNNADVIFGVAGNLNNSIFDAVKAVNSVITDHAKQKHAIGVDIDQSSISEYIVTSATKNIQKAVYLSLLDAYNLEGHSWKGTNPVFYGVENDAVELLPGKDKWRLTNFTYKDYTDLYALLKNNTVTVPATKDELKTYLTTLLTDPADLNKFLPVADVISK